MRPFLVIGTPRSRTAWLADFLSTPERPCVHEPSLHFREPADLDRFLANDAAAASDSMMTFLAGRAREIRPDVFIVKVHRPLADIEASFAGMGLAIAPGFLAMMERRVQSFQADLAVEFSGLKNWSICQVIYEACTAQPCSYKRWQTLDRVNIQSHPPDQLRLLRENFHAHQIVFGPYYDRFD